MYNTPTAAKLRSASRSYRKAMTTEPYGCKKQIAAAGRLERALFDARNDFGLMSDSELIALVFKH